MPVAPDLSQSADFPREFWPENPGSKMLDVRCGNLRAVAPSHQHAILGFAQVGDAHGKPDPDRRQCDGKGKGGDVGQHAMAEIVRLFPVALVA